MAEAVKTRTYPPEYTVQAGEVVTTFTGPDAQAKECAEQYAASLDSQRAEAEQQPQAE